jgi:pilus assembly protein Flp/PilA
MEGYKMNLIKRLIKEEEGQGLVEYALIVGLIALVAIVAITASGVAVNDIWNAIKVKLEAIA